MFTGIVEDIGTIVSVENRNGNKLITIKSSTVCEDIELGDSVSINGTCLTVVDHAGSNFKVEATKHTVANTNISKWHSGSKVNLERALRVGDRFGGHMVQGHIDGLGTVSRVRFMAGSSEYTIEAPRKVRDNTVNKGSITIDGVSLTIASKTKLGFTLMLIPFTLENTTLGLLKPGDRVNIETDIVFRWLAERYPRATNENRSDTWDNSFSQVEGIHSED